MSGKYYWAACVPLLALFPASLEAGVGFGGIEGVSSRLIHWLAFSIEMVGIGIIAVGAVATSALFLVSFLGRQEASSAYHDFRANLGRAILLGLEFLVAADIIGTVAVDPTFSNVGVLALIILVRTFLSFSLEVEIEGAWPWQRGSRS